MYLKLVLRSFVYVRALCIERKREREREREREIIIVQRPFFLYRNTCNQQQVFGHEMSRDVRKPDFCICENKDADQLRLCFRHLDSTIPLSGFLTPKFQVSSHLLLLHSLVCVGPGRKPRTPVS